MTSTNLPNQKQLTIKPPKTFRMLLEWTNAILLSLGLTMVAGEIAVRYVPIPVEPITNGVYFIDHPEMFRDQNNEFGYEPYSTNREGAVYTDYKQAWVEYNHSFTVNNAGLVQVQQIDPSRKYTVFVGDSFMHGLGAAPWFYNLERELPSMCLANLGVVSAGAAHWTHAVDWFANSHAGVDKVAIMFIEDDFFRPYWTAVSSQDRVASCYEDRCRNMFVKRQDIPPEALIQNTYEQPELGASKMEWLKQKVKARVVQLQLGQWLINMKQSLRTKDREFLQLNKNSFEQLVRQHPTAFALHVPRKHEAQSQRWSAESLEIKLFVQSTGVRYVDGMVECRLTITDFHRYDDHPNSVGYDKIKQCITQLLKDESRQL